MADVVAVNLDICTAIFDDGYEAEFTDLIDADGDDTDDIDDAVVAIAQDAQGLWHTIVLGEFEPLGEVN